MVWNRKCKHNVGIRLREDVVWEPTLIYLIRCITTDNLAISLIRCSVCDSMVCDSMVCDSLVANTPNGALQHSLFHKESYVMFVVCVCVGHIGVCILTRYTISKLNPDCRRSSERWEMAIGQVFARQSRKQLKQRIFGSWRWCIGVQKNQWVDNRIWTQRSGGKISKHSPASVKLRVCQPGSRSIPKHQ